MILKRLALLFCLLALVVSTIAQQTSTPSSSQGVRDAQAVAVVQSALGAMGGTATLAAIQNSVVTGTSVDQTTQQNASQSSSSSSFTWTYAGDAFRNEINAADGSHVLISNGGNPQDFHDGAWNGLPSVVSRTNLPYHIPALVLFAELSNPGYAFVFLGSTTVNGAAVIHVQTRDDSDLTGHRFTVQDWYFSSGTGLPSRVEVGIPVSQNPQESLHEATDFSNFLSVGGVLVPFQLTVTSAPYVSTATINSVVFNTNINANIFAPSTSGAQ
jgi:hypothetical protein